MYESVKLVDAESGDSLTIWPRADNGDRIALLDLDVGFPVVREDSVDRTGSSGTFNYTQFYGSRAVSLSVKILDQQDTIRAANTRSELAAWMDPIREINLTYKLQGQEERYMCLRSSNMSRALSRENLVTGNSNVQLQWVCPLGKEFATEQRTLTISRGSTSTIPGRAYPLTFSRVYPAQVGIGAAMAFNGGSVATDVKIRIFGPLTSPRILNDTAGKTLEMLGFTLVDGEYVEIDSANKTVQLNGIPGADTNRRNALTTREWWTLAKGDNLIRFTSATGSPPAQVQIISEDAWM